MALTQEDTRQLERKYFRLKEENNMKDVYIDKLQAELNRKYGQANGLHKEKIALHKELLKLKKKLVVEHKDWSSFKEEPDKWKEELTQEKEKVSELSQDKLALEKDIMDMRDKLQDRERVLHECTSTITEKDKAINTYIDQLSRAKQTEKDFQKLQAENSAFKEQNKTLMDEKTAWDMKVNQLTTELDRKISENITLIQDKTMLENQLTDSKKYLDDKVREKEGMLQDNKKTVEKHEKDIKQLNDEMALLRQKNKTLSDEKSVYEVKIGQMTLELNRIDSEKNVLIQEKTLLEDKTRRWLHLSEKIKQQNPQKDDAEIDKQIELLMSAEILLKPEIAVDEDGRRNTEEKVLRSPQEGYETSNGVRITLVKGDVALQKADVVVVSTTPEFDLSQGAVRAVLNAGGKEFEAECRKQIEKENRSGRTIVVDGGQRLECSKVFLAGLSTWDGDDTLPIREAVMSSLLLASEQRHKTIVFSAMGTATNKYPKDKVAIEMYQAVDNYATENAGSTLEDVIFAVYDPDTISAFEAEEKFRKESVKPVFECDIGGIQMQVVLGDILEQRVDVIVCEVDSELKFSGGMAQVLQQKCPEIVQDVQRKRRDVERDGIVVSGSFGLPARKCIHVTFADTPLRWKQMIKCLNKANEKEYQTISFPLLGAGQEKSTCSDTDEITTALFNAADTFAQQNQDSKIKCIKLVLPNKEKDQLAVAESMQCLVLKADKRKHKEGQIVGFLLSTCGK